MPKLKPLSIGLTLGIFLAILYAIRTIIIWLFPNFVVNLAKKVTYNMVSVQPAVITADAFMIGIIVLFVAGFVWGIAFALINNWINK
ncbi:MAG: DUF5676 family membrane protein [Nanoarchaeota archaeon]